MTRTSLDDLERESFRARIKEYTHAEWALLEPIVERRFKPGGAEYGMFCDDIRRERGHVFLPPYGYCDPIRREFVYAPHEGTRLLRRLLKAGFRPI